MLAFSFAAILSAGFYVSTASGQDSAPINPLAIRMQISDLWFLTITSNGQKTNSAVVYDSAGFLNKTRASVSINDCNRMAEAIEVAADAVEKGALIEPRQLGDIRISIGKDTEGHGAVKLSGGEKGLLFTSPLEQLVPPEEARKFAQSLRAVPGIHARLMSSIDFAAIWRKK